jgi:hypothetical protein
MAVKDWDFVRGGSRLAKGRHYRSPLLNPRVECRLDLDRLSTAWLNNNTSWSGDPD